MTDRFAGRGALVTGAARGFGRAIARMLAAEGADVAVADLGSARPSAGLYAASGAQELHAAAAEVEALGRRAVAIQADVTSESDCARMATEAIGGIGAIDLLVVNAGVWTRGRAWELSERDWDLVLDVNLKGAWLTAKHVAPHMVARRSGRIVFTSSIGGIKAYGGMAHYIAAKHGVIGLMRALAIELGPHDINVNAVCPTQMGKPVESGGRDRSWDEIVGHANATAEEVDIVVGRENLFETRGTPDFEDVAEGVLWLLSDGARTVTGQALALDNGWVVKRGG